ncbi:hypothetical protein JCM10908_003694 [Rhodotorula pacifica]|uniref:Rav1p n=1 Tax=Rhodotorula pacifica TaxID=1495444 RepID=UPI00317D3BD7
MPSLVLQETAVASPNAGPHTVASTVLNGKPLLVSAAGNRVDLLDEACGYVKGLPFAEAFPGTEEGQRVDAVAVDASSGRIAASSGRRVAVWTAGRANTWRVHSTFATLHDIIAIDFSQNTLVTAGDRVSLWSLDEAAALPTWVKTGTFSCAAPISLSRISPSALVLATVTSMSSSVLLSNILPRSAAIQNRLQFRSRAAHAARIRSIAWRPSDAMEDSGPVLFTQTMDGVYRIWGCVIDEPDFFSLWCSLDVHSTLPKQLPLATMYWRTRPMAGSGNASTTTTNGTADEFVTVFSDGAVHLTTVSNFDSRPPTCLVQSTRVLQENVFEPAQLANMRYPHLLPSESDVNSLHLVGRCSRGTLVHARARRLDAIGSKRIFHDAPTSPPVNLVGRVKQLAPTANGEALLVLGENGRVQSWEMGQDEVITDMAVGEAAVPPNAKIATWHDGRFFAVAAGRTLRILKFRHSKRLQFLASLEVDQSFDDLVTFFAVRASDETFSTTIVTLSANFEIRTFVYNHASRALHEEMRRDVASANKGSAPLRLACAVPPDRNSNVLESVSLLTMDAEGSLTRWHMELADPTAGWQSDNCVRTGIREAYLVACSVDGTSAVASRSEETDSTRLAIWDPKASEFSSGEQFSCTLDEELVQLDWSKDGTILACVSPARVLLYAARRLEDLAPAPSWETLAEISTQTLLPCPITGGRWLASGLAIAVEDQTFFYSPDLEGKGDIHELARSRIAPLPLHHPQLLFQALLQGHFDAVTRILVGLAGELTSDGHLTPVPMRGEQERLTIEAFLRNPSRSTKKAKRVSDDVFSALTTAEQAASSAPQSRLTADDLSRLVAALHRRALRDLSRLDHEHLSVLAQTVYETQERRGSIDDNGLRYLIAMRSFFLYQNAAHPSHKSTAHRLSYRDIVFAFHSESQELLLEEGTKASGGHATWSAVRSLGAAMWLRSPDALVRTMETVGRTEFVKPGADDRDPISAMLFYLALRKPHVVMTFWKQASGHSDQRQMLKFLANDFGEQRWKSAALKNAFALLSKQRFLFAAAFFLLGESLKDAVNVCVRQLDDLQLAIALARTYEGDSGPVLRTLLEETVLPLAFRDGQRWLATWALWMLGRRDLAVQAVITPLSVLATRLPYRLDLVSSPARENPTLVFLFGQLRGWSLQTVKGALAVPGKTEFTFVLHIARILCRMGCHLLALNLLRTWTFPSPPPKSRSTGTTAAQRPSLLGDRRRHSLLRSSTILDVTLPASNLPSRAASPTPPHATEHEAEERERQRRQFREVVQTVKVEAKAPAEFSLDAFGF